MPRIYIEDEEIEVPPYMPGAEIQNLPAVRERREPGETVFVSDPETRNYTIVEDGKDYQLRDGHQLGVAPRTESGRR